MDAASLVVNVVVIVATAGACYGAIRADLRHLRDSVTRAHERIDDHLQQHATN